MAQMQKIGKHATKVYRDIDRENPTESRIYVKYHDTVIVTVGDGWVRLNSGGWETVSTKTRMNQAANEFGLEYYVHQTHGVWHVTWAKDGRATTAKFFDGMHIWPEGDFWKTYYQGE